VTTGFCGRPRCAPSALNLEKWLYERCPISARKNEEERAGKVARRKRARLCAKDQKAQGRSDAASSFFCTIPSKKKRGGRSGIAHCAKDARYGSIRSFFFFEGTSCARHSSGTLPCFFFRVCGRIAWTPPSAKRDLQRTPTDRRRSLCARGRMHISATRKGK